jgi:filamentous hemagglutinin
LIDLTGSQLLLSDATLLGASGGKTAVGGTLSISSGKFHREGGSQNNAEANLYVKQSGNVILNPSSPLGVGVKVADLS